jgi:dihydrofolate reductase
MKISIVVAASLDNAIGRNNDLLWKLPADMRFFKNLTWGMPVIMGRKTFESMKSKPLPGRVNIVITSQSNLMEENDQLRVAESLITAINIAASTDCLEAFIIGGGEIYRQSMSIADRIYLTRVETHFPNADTHFSDIDTQAFGLTDSFTHHADEKHNFPFRFETWDRILNAGN